MWRWPLNLPKKHKGKIKEHNRHGENRNITRQLEQEFAPRNSKIKSSAERLKKENFLKKEEINSILKKLNLWKF